MALTRLRIVHVPGLTSFKYGGFERFMFAMADECAARGHRFAIVWEKRPTSDAFCEDLAAAGAETLVLPARGHAFPFMARLTRRLERIGADVVHGHFNPAGTLAVVAARLAGVPLVLATNRSGMPQWLQTQGLPLRSRLVAMARRSFSARVFTVSRTVASQYARLGLGGCRLVPRYTGVPLIRPSRSRDEVRATFGFDAEDLVIGCVAFPDPIKGVDVLLRAMPRLAEVVPRVKLLQVGCAPDAEQTRRLRHLAENLGVADRVVWAGRRDDVPDLLPALDVYCQPSRSEGLPLGILEAMGSGLAVVATSVGGIGEAVISGRTGMLVPPDRPERIADALGELLRNPSQRRRMGRCGRERIRRHFVLEKQTRELVDTYEAMWRTIRG